MLAHEEKLKKAIDHIVEGLTPTELITNNGISSKPWPVDRQQACGHGQEKDWMGRRDTVLTRRKPCQYPRRQYQRRRQPSTSRK
jgi:hypothetical protein